MKRVHPSLEKHLCICPRCKNDHEEVLDRENVRCKWVERRGRLYPVLLCDVCSGSGLGELMRKAFLASAAIRKASFASIKITVLKKGVDRE